MGWSGWTGLVATLAVLAVGSPGGGDSLDAATAEADPAAVTITTQYAITKPRIAKRLIPYGQKRKNDMAAYSNRHYGQREWRLTDPKQIVIHFAVAGSIDAI